MSGMAPPPPPRGRHLTARDALIVAGIVVCCLVILVGRSVRHAGNEMTPGWERTLVLAVGRPAGWVADKLPLENLVADATKPLKSGEDFSSGPGAFASSASGAAAGGVVPVTPDAFDPVALGAKPGPARPLKTVLVTGDSMSLLLDAQVARRLTAGSIKTIRDPHLGTGLSVPGVADWGRLSVAQVKHDRPDAVVVFIGANEGYPLNYAGRSYQCCGPQWAAAYATRARTVMNTFRQGGVARVYWLLLPAPRDPRRQKISTSVNLADSAAAAPYRAQVRLLDMSAIFTPGGRYRDAMSVNGSDQIVRQADGIHLNQAGASIAADAVVRALRIDYGRQVPGG
jgi:lysophospholipase L1-like esterase